MAKLTLQKKLDRLPHSRNALAQCLGLSASGLCRRMSGKIEWKLEDAIKLQHLTRGMGAWSIRASDVVPKFYKALANVKLPAA